MPTCALYNDIEHTTSVKYWIIIHKVSIQTNNGTQSLSYIPVYVSFFFLLLIKHLQTCMSTWIYKYLKCSLLNCIVLFMIMMKCNWKFHNRIVSWWRVQLIASCLNIDIFWHPNKGPILPVLLVFWVHWEKNLRSVFYSVIRVNLFFTHEWSGYFPGHWPCKAFLNECFVYVLFFLGWQNQ